MLCIFASNEQEFACYEYSWLRYDHCSGIYIFIITVIFILNKNLDMKYFLMKIKQQKKSREILRKKEEISKKEKSEETLIPKKRTNEKILKKEKLRKEKRSGRNHSLYFCIFSFFSA